MKQKLYRIMVKAKLFTASILAIFIIACGEKKEEVPLPPDEPKHEQVSDDEDVEMPELNQTDSSTETRLIGKWELTHVDGKVVGDNKDLKGNYQVFLSDHSWVWLHQTNAKDSAVALEGAQWHYEPTTNQINLVFTDSAVKTFYINEMMPLRMQVEMMDQSIQTWRKIAYIKELPPLKDERKEDL